MITEVKDKKAEFRQYGKSQARKDIEDFRDSGWDACEIDISRYSDITSAHATYCRMLKVYYNGIDIKASRRNGRLYLIRV